MRILKLIVLLLISSILPIYVSADSPRPKILLVEDSHYKGYPYGGFGDNDDIAPYFIESLNANGYSYDICVISGRTEDGPGYSSDPSNGGCEGTYMKDYDIIIWFTGNDFGGDLYPTLTLEDRNNLQTFLNNGGRLFLTGQDIGYDIGTTSFYTNYLHANFSYDSNNYKYLYGERGDPVGNGKRIYIGFEDEDGAKNQYYPSIIEPIDNYATGSFDYKYNCQTNDLEDCEYGTWFGAIRADTGVYKVVYFAFGFEGIKGADDRESVMDWVIGFLSAPDTKDTIATPVIANSFVTLNATCVDNELFSYVRMAEYFINSTGADGSGNNFTAVDGIFDEPTEFVTVDIDVTDTNIFPNDGNYTIYVHCQDKSGYWGKFDNISIVVDRTAPTAPFILIENDANYTNDETPILTLIDASYGSNTPDYVRFSCDGVSFSSWVPWNITYDSFNITSGPGCTNSDGTKTVYVQAKDQAGNIQSIIKSDSIILDRTPPYIVSTIPNNNSYLTSTLNITIDVNDSLSGIDPNNLFYNWNGTNYSFSDNISFNPGWGEEGVKTLTIYITDNAGNINTTVLKFIVDNSPPYFISITPANLSAIKSTSTIIITIGENYNLSYSWFNNNIDYNNQSFINNTSFNPGWSTEGNHTLTVWINDSAGNVNSTTYNFTVDDTPPYIVSIIPNNLSNITNSTTFIIDIADDLSGINASWFDNGSGINTSFIDNIGFNPGWSTEGNHTLTVWINDSAGNVNSSVYFFIVDNTPPNTTDNSTNDWVSENQWIYLDCFDNLTSCDTTLYCIHNATEIPCTPNTPGNIVEITCPDGSVCQKYIRYKSNDSAGNWEAVKSSLIRIDKKGPTIQINNPKEGLIYSGILDILTDIVDEGYGVIDTASYVILNASNLSEVINTSILLPPDWNSTWNTSNYSLGDFILNVTANDSLGNTNHAFVNFSIDNQLPTAVINHPFAVYINESFNLDLRGKSANDDVNLSECNYSIYNTSGIINSDGQSLNTTTCSFTNVIDITTWKDGNYTINFTVIDKLGKNQTVESWFYLDKTSPLVSIINPSSGSWNNGTITVNYTSSDIGAGIKIIQWSYYQNQQSNYFTLTDNEGIFLFDTNLCTDTNSSDCVIEIYVEDIAGNMNRTNVSFNVDNSPPEIEIINPSEGSWHNGNFTVLLTAFDNVSQVTCQYRLNGSSELDWISTNCNNLTVDISYCQFEGANTCNLQIKAKNILNMTATAVRNFSIDLTKPYFVSISKSNGSHIRSIDNLSIDIADDLSGINASWFDNGSGINTSFIDNIGFNPGWSTEGNHTLTVWINDSAGNVNSSVYFFIVDNTPPNASDFRFNIIDPIFNDSRLYTGETITFFVNISDISNTSDVNANLNCSGSVENLTLVLSEGDFREGVWNFTFTPTSLGRCIVSRLYINDTLGNEGILNTLDINSSFIVVNASMSVFFGILKEIDAGLNETLNLTFNFNKSVENPELRIYIPPYFTNLSNYICLQSNCLINGSTITTSGNVSILHIQAILKALTLRIDTNSTWITRFNDMNYSDYILIKTPYLNISNILCNDNENCSVNQSQVFWLNVTVNNVYQIGNHTGNAYDVYLNFTSPIISNITSLGKISSGSKKNSSWMLNITEAGNFIFTFFAWDNFTNSYNTTLTKIIHVRDTKQPNITSAEIIDDVVNINETVIVLVQVEDNMNVSHVWLTLTDVDGNLTNHTLHLEAGSMQSGIWNFAFNATKKPGIYTITKIFANDTENNIIEKTFNISFVVKRLEINLTLSSRVLNIGENLTILVNITNNASKINNVPVLIYKPGNTTDTIELVLNRTIGNVSIYNGIYSNITRSGNYTVEVRVVLINNYSHYGNFSVTFGNISLLFGENEPLEIPVSLGPVNLSWFVIPIGGDILYLSAQISINNESIINITPTENSTKTLGNITYEQYPNGMIVRFEFNGSSIGVTNIIFSVNSTSSGIANITVTVNVTPTDDELPFINSFQSNLNKLNLLEPIILRANISDNSIVSNVIFEVKNPNNVTTNYTAHKRSFNLYDFIFPYTDKIGTYYWKIHVFDISNNTNSTDFKNFTVSDTYYISINTPYTIFNKGDIVPITIDVRNVNNVSIDNFNVTVIIYNGTNSTIIENSIISSFNYFINPNYRPLGDENILTYYVYANVSKNGNKGYGEMSFNVSRILTTIWENPENLDYVETGSYIPMQIYVTNAKGLPVTNAYVGVQMSCPYGGCSPTFTLLQNLKNGTYSSTQDLVAPDLSGLDLNKRQFNLLAYSIDRWKNYEGGGISLVLTTTQTSTASTTTGTEAPTTGGGFAQPIEMECKKEGETCEFNYECCSGLCYENVCTGNVTIERVSKELEFIIDDVIDIKRGSNETVRVVLKNKGDINLTLSISVVSKDCCSFYLPVNTIELPVGSSKDLSIIIHVPLYQNLSKDVGTYKFRLRIRNNVDIGRDVQINVIENPVIKRIERFDLNLRRIKSQKNTWYDPFGMDTTNLTKSIIEIENELKRARIFIANDDLDSLKKSIELLEELSIKANHEEILLNNSFWLWKSWTFITGGAIISVFASYFITRLIIPYLKLRKMLMRLYMEEKSIIQGRRTAEIQYFKRQIDEKTFRNIMVMQQDKLMDVRGRIKETKRMMSELLSTVFSIKELVNYIVDIPKNLRKLKHNLKGIRILKRGQLDIEDEFSVMIKKLEYDIKKMKGEKKLKAETELNIAKDYINKGMKIMAKYHLKKCKDIIKRDI